MDGMKLVPGGSLRIHAEPEGLDLKMTSAEWLVIADDSAYAQYTSKDEKDGIFTIRLMLRDTAGSRKPVVSIIIWQGSNTGAVPVYQALEQELSGNVMIRQ